MYWFATQHFGFAFCGNIITKYRPGYSAVLMEWGYGERQVGDLL